VTISLLGPEGNFSWDADNVFVGKLSLGRHPDKQTGPDAVSKTQELLCFHHAPRQAGITGAGINHVDAGVQMQK
jgi:hypothetical protein